MVPEFQTKVAQFIVQYKGGHKYIPIIDIKFFDSPADKIIFGMILDHYKEFAESPGKADLLETFHEELKKQRDKATIDKATIDAIRNRIEEYYVPLNEGLKKVKAVLIREHKKKLTKDFLIENIEGINKVTDDVEFEAMLKKIERIVKVGDPESDSIQEKAKKVLADYEEADVRRVRVIPLQYQGINRLTAHGGFFAPQLIVLLGGPKAFKTGTLINIALGLVRDGYKVYYADTENGKDSIQARFYQAMMNCLVTELRDKKTKEEIEAAIKHYRVMGGDMIVNFYAGKKISDVDKDMEDIKEATNWVPDFIIHDYIDKYAPEDKPKDKRLMIQDHYDNAIKLNAKWGCPALTVSPVNKQAISKEIITVKDFGEDAAKAYNCHASFAWCRTPEEEARGFARWVPVVQREGVRYNDNPDNQVLFRLDEKIMFMEEVKVGEIIQRARNNGKISDD